MTGLLTKEDKKTIAARAYRDPVFFLKFFLSSWFPKDIPWVHRGILAILTRQVDFLLDYGELDKIIANFVWKLDPADSEEEPKPIFHLAEDGTLSMDYTKFTQVMMPRGYAKTTLANGVVLYWICYQEKRFPVYISETQTHAETQLKNVRTQLEVNERLRLVFGDLKPEQRQGFAWTQDMLQTTNGVTVAARGRGGQIRGMNVDAARPDCVLFDDVEDKESVSTAEQRKKVFDWFYSDVIPALPEMDENATILGLGTLLHSEALLMRLQADSDWTSIVFGVWDRQGEPLWPDMMDAEKIERKKNSYARAGQLSIYYMEYENTLRNDEDAKFPKSKYIYLPGQAWEDMQRAICIDPAISGKAGADLCAFGVAGMAQNGVINVLDMFGKVGMSPRDQVDKYFELAMKWKPQKHGVETIAYQKALVHLLKEEMFRKRYFFEVIKIESHESSKTARVEGILQPRFAAGYIVFAKRFPDLEAQLQDWPNGKRDLPDVLAMTVALLDPYAAFATPAGVDLAEDEYPPLDEVLDGEWRHM